MKLVDMKLTKSEKKKDGPMCSSEYKAPDYPYGLRLNLDDAQLEKLGIKSLPKVGSTLTITSKATVISARSNSSERGRNERSIELELRQIGVDTDGGSAEDAVKDALKDA